MAPGMIFLVKVERAVGKGESMNPRNKIILILIINYCFNKFMPESHNFLSEIEGRV